MAPVLVVLFAAVGLAVDDVDVDGAVGGRLDDDLVVEDRVRRRARPRSRGGRTAGRRARPPGRAVHDAERDLDDVARRELRPADARVRVLVRLLDREGLAAVLAVHARAQDLGEVALGGDVLVELVLGARRDDDLARVVDELRDAAVRVHDDGAQPVELAVRDVGRVGDRRPAAAETTSPPDRSAPVALRQLRGRRAHAHAAREDRLRRDEVLLVVVRLGLGDDGVRARSASSAR